MQYVLIFVMVISAIGGLGLITDWKFFFPKSPVDTANPATAESALEILIFNANPSSISLGQHADLVWAVSGASSVVIDQGVGTVAVAGKQSVNPDKTTTYNIVAINSTGTVTKSVTVAVELPASPPVISSFTASSTTVSAGQTVTLKWTTRGATSARIDQGIGEVPVAGTQIVSVSATTVYTLTAANDGGPVSATVRIVVPTTNQPVIESFTVTTEDGYTSDYCYMTAGDPVIMRWNVTGATAISINPTVGTVASSGVTTIYPSIFTIYTLMASNAAGAVTAYTTCNVTEISLPAVASFTLTPEKIKQGESATLKWSVTGADPDPHSISIDQGIGLVDYFGSVVVSPSATTTYIITARNGAGLITGAITLTVIPKTHPQIYSFTASPVSIKSGQSSTLQWNISGATSVSISPGVGIVAPVGSVKVSPAATAVYTITASNAAGSITGYATVNVTK